LHRGGAGAFPVTHPNKENTMFLASLETSHFSFNALDTTEKKAIAALKRGLKIHCNQYNVYAEEMWATYKDDVNVFPIELGGALRDGEELL
jgi:hypothetical protein